MPCPSLQLSHRDPVEEGSLTADTLAGSSPSRCQEAIRRDAPPCGQYTVSQDTSCITGSVGRLRAGKFPPQRRRGWRECSPSEHERNERPPIVRIFPGKGSAHSEQGRWSCDAVILSVLLENVLPLRLLPYPSSRLDPDMHAWSIEQEQRRKRNAATAAVRA
jgi:hypothetical protein